MLNRVVMALFSVPLLLGGVASSAHAEDPVCYKTDPKTGICVIWIEAPGGGGGGGGDGGGEDSNAIVLVIDGQRCTYAGLKDPQPPKDDPIWEGHIDGAIYACDVPPKVLPGTIIAGYQISFWGAAPPALPPPDPRVLAQQAMDSMGLKAINIGIVPEDVPGSVGIIGMPTWMWVEAPDEATMGPITRSASARGYTVTAVAKVTKIVWNMGDGRTIVCTGPGTPYADSYGKKISPTCGYTYTRQGRYTVSATSYWTVNWAGIGQTGTIPIDFTTRTNITMGESQVINQ
mgnify:CR=1 FL=1